MPPATREYLGLLARSMPTALRRSLDYSGRTRRGEYWSFILGFALLVMAAWGVDVALGTGDIVRGVVSLVLVVPLFAATTRRLHDTGRSGWLQLLWLLPFGFVLITIWAAQATRQHPAYGPSSRPPGVAAPPSGAWKTPKPPPRVTHLDGDGRVVAAHLRGEPCPVCGPVETHR